MWCKNKLYNLFSVFFIIITSSNFCVGQQSFDYATETKSAQYCFDYDTMTSRRCTITNATNSSVLPCETPCENNSDFFTISRCVLSEGMAIWSEIYNPCESTSNLSNLTTFLNSAQPQFTPNILRVVSTKIEAESSTLSESDVERIANILANISNQFTKIEYTEPFFGVVNNLLNVNHSVLKSSREFGSTDKIIKSVDNFVIDLSNETTSYLVNLPNIALEIVKPIQTNLNDHYNITFNNISVKIPNEMLTTSMLTTFKTNHLFPEGNVVTEIFDLKVLGVSEALKKPISLYLHVNTSIEVVCSFWKFNEEGIGNWSNAGVETIRLSDDLVECKTNHLTAFVLLGISDRIIENLSEANQFALQIITTILCSFSLTGLTMVFITCFVLKKWYTKRINTIQISGIIALEILLIFLNDIITIENDLGCKFFGIFMHYLVLVKFIVMLLIAKKQYDNFVSVLTSRNTSQNFLITTFIAFSVPIVIVGISAGIFPEHYNSGNVNFCYPKDKAFSYFLIIPIALILIVNIIIFSLVMFKISSSISRDRKQKILQIKLASMLFFMLGLTWIFSVLSYTVFTPWLQLLFIYVFSILSPLQGFVIFLFAIVFDKDAKTFWFDCCQKLTYSSLGTENTKTTTSTAIVLSSITQPDAFN